MNERVKRLHDGIVTFGNEITAEKMRITVESEARTQGWPSILRRAQSFYDVATQIPVWVNDDELIVGTPASKPWALEIESCLGKTEFPRIRVGTGDRPKGQDLAAWVLGHPGPEERKLLEAAFDRAAECAMTWARDGIEKAMQTGNQG